MESRWTTSTVCLLGLLLVIPAVSGASHTYLEAAFNDKTLDQPIGTGGAAAGEPVSVSSAITAIVREGPTGSPCLEIRDNSDVSAGYARFEFLDSEELTTGIVDISVDLWFYALTEGYSFSILVREQGSSAENFADLAFSAGGTVFLNDEGGSVGVIGTYEPGALFRLILEFDMDAGTYDVWLDGQKVVEGEPHGVTGRGVGAVLFGASFDVDLEGVFSIDALAVTDFFQATPPKQDTWGGIKAQFGR